MPNFNYDDVDFDLNNLRVEDDWWNRMVRTHNDFDFNNSQNSGLPIDGDALIEERSPERVTQTVLDLYNKFEKKGVL